MVTHATERCFEGFGARQAKGHTDSHSHTWFYFRHQVYYHATIRHLFKTQKNSTAKQSETPAHTLMVSETDGQKIALSWTDTRKESKGSCSFCFSTPLGKHSSACTWCKPATCIQRRWLHQTFRTTAKAPRQNTYTAAG